MNIRLIAFDLDGTLLNSEKTVSPRTKAALTRAAEHGVVLVPATGPAAPGSPGGCGLASFASICHRHQRR